MVFLPKKMVFGLLGLKALLSQQSRACNPVQKELSNPAVSQSCPSCRQSGAQLGEQPQLPFRLLETQMSRAAAAASWLGRQKVAGETGVLQPPAGKAV